MSDTTEPAESTGLDDREGLRRLVRKGLGWSLGRNAFSRLGIFLTGVILARLLDPTDYGAFAVAMVALVIIANLNDLGLEQTLVRWPGDLKAVAPTAATVIFASSCVLFVVGQLGAAPFASALNAPEATGMVRLLLVGVLINGACAVPSAVLTRAFAQDRRTWADAAGFVVSTVITVWMAVEGYGAWSLAWGRVAGNAVTSGMHVVLAKTRYRPGWSLGIARDLLRHGLPLAGASLLAVALLNVDYLVVGRVLDAENLGYYLMAFNLSSWPVSMLSTAVAMVAVPGFARLQHDHDELRRSFLSSLDILGSVAFPIAAVVAVTATPLIGFVYGEVWTPAAAALHGLAVLGGFRVALLLTGDLLVAAGRGRAMLGMQLVWFVAVVPALAVGAHLGGIAGVGVAHLVVAAAVVTPVAVLALARLDISPGAVARAVARPLVGAALAAAVAAVVVWIVPSAFAGLALAGTLGLAVHLAVVAPAHRRAGAPPPAAVAQGVPAEA